MTRVLLAIADPDLLAGAAALVQESGDLFIADRAGDADEVLVALRRQEVDVCVLHDGVGAGPAIELVREIAGAFPETGIVILSADASPALLRTAMQAGARDVVPLPLSFEQLDASIRSAGAWARALRERVAGEESAAAAGLGGPLIAVAGAKGGVGATTVALHLALAAVRATRPPPPPPAAGATSTCSRATCARSWTRRTGAPWPTSWRSPRRSPSATSRRRCTPTGRASGCCSRRRRASATRRSAPPSRAPCWPP